MTFISSFVPGDDTVDRWYNSDFVYGTGMTGTPEPEDVNFAIGVPGPGGSLRGTLKISMCGFTDMEHDVEVLVNGVPAGRYRWSGITFSEEALSRGGSGSPGREQHRDPQVSQRHRPGLPGRGAGGLDGGDVPAPL